MNVSPFPETHGSEKGVLDRAVTRYLEIGNPVSGRWLRSGEPRGIPDALMPNYLQRRNDPPDDTYRPTPLGLFRSSHGHRCLDLLDAIVSSLSRMYRIDPDLRHYSRTDVWGSGVTPESATSLVAVIGACRLGGSGNYSTHDFHFSVPQDIEHVAGHTTGRSMLQCAECERTRWSPEPPAPEERPSLNPPDAPALQLNVQRAFDCSFISDKGLAQIIQRDCDEIEACMGVKAWKATIILCGSALEGLLTFALETTGQRGPNDKATLSDLIRLGTSTGLLAKMASALPDALREHRNLIHPGKERGSSYRIDGPEAEIAIGILRAAFRDVADALRPPAR